jgi:hypothetical protein
MTSNIIVGRIYILNDGYWCRTVKVVNIVTDEYGKIIVKWVYVKPPTTAKGTPLNSHSKGGNWDLRVFQQYVGHITLEDYISDCLINNKEMAANAIDNFADEQLLRSSD